MHHFHLDGASSASDIYINAGIRTQVAQYCTDVFAPHRVHIVTDDNVAPRYLATIVAQFTCPVSHTILPAGEEHKRLSAVERIYQDLIANACTRKDLVIALGGGVIGDVAGFAAATYLRGVPLCQIPTTLLSQVDSSVGGKTAVDLPQGKNLVGAFYQPRLVLIDPEITDILRHECPTIFIDGMGEVLKYGYIANPAILDMAGVGTDGFTVDILAELIAACVSIKCDVVQQDEHDNGLRMILNYGHTLAHAIEKLGNYTTYGHGQAVSMGMVAAMSLAVQRGEAPQGQVDAMISLLQANQLATTLPYAAEDLFTALLSDKKRAGDTMNFILVRTLGQADIVPLPLDELQAQLARLWAHQ